MDILSMFYFIVAVQYYIVLQLTVLYETEMYWTERLYKPWTAVIDRYSSWSNIHIAKLFSKNFNIILSLVSLLDIVARYPIISSGNQTFGLRYIYGGNRYRHFSFLYYRISPRTAMDYLQHAKVRMQRSLPELNGPVNVNRAQKCHKLPYW